MQQLKYTESPAFLFKKVPFSYLELTLSRETLVIFTSDNGGYTHYYQNRNNFENISDNGPLRGQKTEVYEGGHRVPFIAYWPGQVKSGTKTDNPVMTMDLFPTFAELAGADVPEYHKIDGISILPVLLEEKKLPERTLYWKIGDDWAIRQGPWKLINEDNDRKLFNLTLDISESQNISSSKQELKNYLTSEFSIWVNEMDSFSSRWDD